LLQVNHLLATAPQLHMLYAIQNVTNVVAYLNSGLVPFETNTANNKISVVYVPFSIRFNPVQIDVYRGEPTTLQPINSGDKATTIVWNTTCRT